MHLPCIVVTARNGSDSEREGPLTQRIAVPAVLNASPLTMLLAVEVDPHCGVQLVPDPSTLGLNSDSHLPANLTG